MIYTWPAAVGSFCQTANAWKGLGLRRTSLVCPVLHSCRRSSSSSSCSSVGFSSGSAGVPPADGCDDPAGADSDGAVAASASAVGSAGLLRTNGLDVDADGPCEVLPPLNEADEGLLPLPDAGAPADDDKDDDDGSQLLRRPSIPDSCAKPNLQKAIAALPLPFAACLPVLAHSRRLCLLCLPDDVCAARAPQAVLDSRIPSWRPLRRS